MRFITRWLRRVLRWPFVLGWMALIFAGSSVPNEVVAAASPRIALDKVAHFGEYSVLAFLLAGVARRSARGRVAMPLLAVGCIVLAAAYGASDEFHQRFVPGRDAGLDDLAADAIGATAGALAAVLLLPKLDPMPPDGATDGGSASARRAP
jgi:hypothetical protein